MKKPWYVRRSRENDPAQEGLGLWDSKHSRGGKKKAGRKSHEGRVARAITNNWPRGRS